MDDAIAMSVQELNALRMVIEEQGTNDALEFLDALEQRAKGNHDMDYVIAAQLMNEEDIHGLF